MQSKYYTCIYLVKLGFILFYIVYENTNVFLIWNSTSKWRLVVPNVWIQNDVKHYLA
jgi:hypothetical protein